MANLDAPHGFVPAKSLIGAPFSIYEYDKLVGYGTAVGKYDLVISVSTGNDVNRAAAGGPFLGTSLLYSAASTAAVVPVVIATPSTIFEAQEDGLVTPLAAEDIGENADVIVTGAANATSGLSQMEIDSDTAANTSTLDLNLWQLNPVPGNAVGANASYFVIINDCQRSNLTAGQ